MLSLFHFQLWFVFFFTCSLQQQDPEEFLNHLSVLMEEPDHQKAATALQRHYENALAKDKDLHKLACLGNIININRMSGSCFRITRSKEFSCNCDQPLNFWRILEKLTILPP